MPAEINFTKVTIEALPNASKGKRVYYLDINKKSEDIKGFGLVVEHTGKKHFVLTQYFKRDRQTVRLRCGEFPHVTIYQAREKARELQYQLKQGIHPHDIAKEQRTAIRAEKLEEKRARATFGEVWEEYVAQNKTGWSESHIKDHQKSMQPGGLPRQRSNKKTVPGVLYGFRNTKLGDINPQKILNWIRREEKSRPIVVARGYRLLRACLNWVNMEDAYQGLVDVDRLFNNPNIRKALPKSKPKKDTLEGQHLPLWFEAVRAINNPVVSAYLQGLLLTGARRTELSKLRWEDVDFKWNSLRIRDKEEGERVIPLTPYLAQILNNLPRQNEWVFSSPQSKTGSLKDPYRAHSTAIAMAGLPHVSLHGLRRSFGSLSEWVECPAGVAAQIQGHKPSATAEKHYRVRPLDLLRKWHTKIEKQILEFGGIKQPLSSGASIRRVK